MKDFQRKMDRFKARKDELAKKELNFKLSISKFEKFIKVS
jgi:hypothetical protein